MAIWITYHRLFVDSTIDLQGKMVLPTWCDSHTHIVHAGNREQEFVDRINGLTTRNKHRGKEF
jgi:imidazolonepropionase